MKNLILILFVCSSLLGFSQNTDSTKTPTRTVGGIEYEIHNVDKVSFIIKNNGDTLYQVVEVMPEFPGGVKNMFKFLRKNLKYPNDVKTSGKVFVNFIVTKDGILDKIKVIRSVHPLLDNEAIRVIKLMPKWNPGQVNGKKADVSFNLPINFVLK